MLEAALDAVVTMDADGRVIGWNHAAEAIFGSTASEAIGRDMAELIVPPRLRAAHRHGLARFVETGSPVVLDRRLELTGARRDGSEFPVELTITRIALPGPPTFTGYLRDITMRVSAIQELRASRARLVEVADAERQRIQRNLHDGAQQRLTSALLSLGRIRASSDEHAALLELAIDELATGLQEVRQLAGGLHPSMLTERGLVAALEALALRRFAIEERSMLTARAGGGAEPAVNDVVLRRAPGAPLADVGLHVGGKQLAHYRGDGVIVATPTGSTGYSRSAGGPLVSPRLAATVVTPLASHAAPAGSLVLSAGDPIELRLADAGPALAIEIDGRERQVVLPAARVRIDQSGPPCRLVRLRHQLARTPRSARRL
jgi:PAS domain S-box-containing protein